MSTLLIIATDLIAILALVFGVYYRRHRGRDMVLPFLGLNVSVLAVCHVLSGVSVGIGVGLGLFGVLAIIRLRSREISHAEVAYYFAALALGLICGLRPSPGWLAPALSALVLVTFAAADQPRWHATHRHQQVVVDTVWPTEDALRARLEQVLSGRVEWMNVLRTDLVRDVTVVDVRYRVLPTAVVPDKLSPTNPAGTTPAVMDASAPAARSATF